MPSCRFSAATQAVRIIGVLCGLPAGPHRVRPAPDHHEIQRIIAPEVVCVSLGRHHGLCRLFPSALGTPDLRRSPSDAPGSDLDDGAWPIPGNQSIERAIPFPRFGSCLGDVHRAVYNAVHASPAVADTVCPIDYGTDDAVGSIRVCFSDAIRL